MSVDDVGSRASRPSSGTNRHSCPRALPRASRPTTARTSPATACSMTLKLTFEDPEADLRAAPLGAGLWCPDTFFAASRRLDGNALRR